VKHDRNDNCIKRRKVGERNVSSDEDPSPLPVWSRDEPSATVNWSEMSRSSSPSPPWVVEMSSSRRPESVACEKGAGLSSRSGAHPV
jgi:hypothetical protein